MTLATTIAKKVYTTDDSTTEFPFPYRFFATTDLVVTKYTIADGTEEILTEETDYTVAGGDDGDGGTTDYTSGGTVTLTAAAGDGYKLIIERTLPITQTYDLAPNSDFSEDTFEEMIDRIVSILQQQQSILDRCIKMDKSNSSVSSVFDVEDLTVEIPSFVIDELTAKTTISTTDYIPIADSSDSNVNKKILQSSLINIANYTAKSSLHDNDVFILEDSQASYVKKKVLYSVLVGDLSDSVDAVESDLSDLSDAVDAKFNTSTGHDHDGTDSKKVSITNIDGLTVAAGDYQASTDGKIDGWTCDTERTVDIATYTECKTFTCPVNGVLRIKFAIKMTSWTINARIYRNDVAVGTEQSDNSGAYVTKSEDISGWSVGDKIQLFVKSNNAEVTGYVKEFRIYCDKPMGHFAVMKDANV